MKKTFTILVLFLYTLTSMCQSDIFSNIKDRTFELNKKKSETKINTFSNPFSQKSFMPDMALVINFSYLNRNLDPDTFSNLEIPGFSHSHSEHEGHSHGNTEEGFNVNYAELSMGASVDPYFDLFATFHLSESSFEVEEAYISTRSLPAGLQIKLGKFLSAFGRLNSQHAHYWNFDYQPLIYKVFFGEEDLLEKGIQLNWVAPFETYVLFGIETLQGNNEASFGTEGFEIGEQYIADTSKPNLFTCFLKSSFDIGKTSFLYGTSYAKGKTRINHISDNPNEEESHGLTGESKIFGLDFTAKYFIDSYRYISLTTEYITRNMDGLKYTEINNTNLTKKQSGFYADFVYKFGQNWRTGFRYDLLNKNEIKENGITQVVPENLKKSTFMIEYNTSEFSRIRLEYTNDNSNYLGDNQKNLNEVSLQFNMIIGAHGAHSF